MAGLSVLGYAPSGSFEACLDQLKTICGVVECQASGSMLAPKFGVRFVVLIIDSKELFSCLRPSPVDVTSVVNNLESSCCYLPASHDYSRLMPVKIALTWDVTKYIMVFVDVPEERAVFIFSVSVFCYVNEGRVWVQQRWTS
jgi:hypothetical protein